MNIEGLDYNTKREKLILPEYGREIQKMVEHAISLPTKEERQRCANTIIGIMERMNPQTRENEDYEMKLWDHLALISDFKLDIAYPCDVSQAKTISSKPDTLAYPANDIPVRHYGKMMFKVFDRLRTMEPGPERDALVCITANQMKRSLMQWSHGSTDDEKVATDLARFTGGAIQLDLETFKFQKVNEKEFSENKRRRKS